MEPLVVVLAVVLMLIGLVGVVVPVMPGLVIVWVVSVGTTLWAGTDAAGWALALVLTLLFASGTAATVVLPTRQGRRGGAPATSLAAAAAGAVIGFFVIPVAGFLLGAAGGFLLAEQHRIGDWAAALSSLGRVLRAYGTGVLVELVLGVLMIATWAVVNLLR